MFSFLSASRPEVKQSALLSTPFGLKRAAFTFDSQQDFEDKRESVSGSLSLSVAGAIGSPAKSAWAKKQAADEETGQLKYKLAVPGYAEKPDVNILKPGPIKTPSQVPSITITADDSSSDTLFAAPDLLSDGNNSETDEKENYDFLTNDGRWHHKPHVYEYNKASARLLDTARPNLFGTIRDTDRTCPKKCVLNVATMQAMVIRTYQREIIEAGKEMMDGKMSVLLPQLLTKYCEALRNMDYMEEKAANGFDHDPFLLQTSKQMERELMQDYGLIPNYMHPSGDLPDALDCQDPRLPGVGRTNRIHKAQLENRYHKLYSALGGGLALIIPMIIMRLEPGKVSCLVTASGCVALFSLVIAFRSNMRPNEILAVTAAYTAVLVVFVGTTT